jgi:hypothetical protein
MTNKQARRTITTAPPPAVSADEIPEDARAEHKAEGRSN